MGKECNYVRKKVGKVAEDGKVKELLYDPLMNARRKLRDELCNAGCEGFCSFPGKLQSVAEES